MVDSQLTPRIRELIRQGAWMALNPSPEWLEELDQATVVTNPTIIENPALAQAVSLSNRTTLIHFATAHLRAPGAPVTPYLGPEPLRMARILARRDVGVTAFDIYRVGQNLALQRWTNIVFELTSDPDELRELLTVMSQSASDFVDATLVGVSRQMQLEHHELAQSVLVERRKIVELILDGDSMQHSRAEARLGYALSGRHTAAIIWCDEHEHDYHLLDRVAEELGQVVGSPRPLTVTSGPGTRWVWMRDAGTFEADRIRELLEKTPTLRIAIGNGAQGTEGFRRSHFDALATQQMMVRLQSRQRVASFDDVHMTALLTQRPDRSDDFIDSTLGAFASASDVLRNTVLTYINEQCNAARASQQLYIHRNTLLSRLDAAQRLLPRPLEHNTVRIAVALEALKWHGTRDQESSSQNRVS
ncbi:transcriptional regulator [Mycobacterium intermedium]|uniref:Transcriptional regulator n=1 Tax=Mycobacterium intermedium TaxID=28445 RepID=A0A1E3SCX2_MYCIE|nr:transcriptional regulator [Mycobacterium intermedium]OPE48627.1 transcriptional regulator [Mycobacterium intermedium]ORB08294.1 transcriptional regulator [Mycobacterium intermedium]